MIYKALLLHLFVYLSIATTYAQSYDVTIEGPPSAIVGYYGTYKASPSGTDIDMVNWDAGIHGWADPYTEHDAFINWLSTGYAKIIYEAQDIYGYFYGEIDVEVVPPTPDATVMNVSYSCGNTAVTRSYLSPYEDYEWYWQTSTTGTSTILGSEASISLITSTPLYLRARDKATFMWSDFQYLGNFTVYTQAPSIPASQAYKIIAGNITLQTDPVPDALEYLWYDENQIYITKTSSPSYTVNASSPTTYYVSAKNGCESSKATISLDVAPEPVIISANGGISMGEPDKLSLNFNYDDHSWIKPDNSEIIGSSTIDADIPGTYTVTVKYGTETKTSSFVVTEIIEKINQNYIISESILVPGIINTGEIDALSVNNRSRTIQYFDGLGRRMQQVNQQASPAKKDIVMPIVYDGFGRETTKYLPYVAAHNNGFYKEDPVGILSSYQSSPHYIFYTEPNSEIARDDKPYAISIMEDSPLNRIKRQRAPGLKATVTDLSLTFEYSNFLANPTGGSGWVKVDVINEQLTVDFNAGFNSSALLTGDIVFVNANIPDMVLGNINSYTVSFNNGYINIFGTGEVLTSFDQTFQVDLATINPHDVKFSYEVNTTTDAVKMWQVSSDGFPYYDDIYPAGELSRTITFDEKDDQVIEFVDKLGQTVLKKVQVNATQWACTYYIYDDYGRLRVVIPPQANETFGDTQVPSGYELLETNHTIATSTGKYMYLPGVTVTISPTITLSPELIIKPYSVTDEMLSDWVFQYRYDDRSRMVAKKVPGAAWVFIVYDQWDRLVLTQDGNQRLENKWNFTKYDVLNRPVITGIVTDIRQADEIQNDLKNETSAQRFETYNGSGETGYTNVSFPRTNVIENLSMTYYDYYNFTTTDFILPLNVFSAPSNDTKIIPAKDPAVKGLITGTKTKILGTGNFITTVNFYDDRYRLIQSYTTNPFQDITDRLTTQYDFSGKVRHTHLNHTKGATSTFVEKKYDYDHAGRLKEVEHKIGADPFVLLAENKYNELGELIDKKLHKEEGQTKFAQSIDYRYNIRGWLTRINDSDLETEADAADDYFGMNLGYNNDIGLDVTPAYNGNISAVKWKNAYKKEKAGYAYSYDAMNRILAGLYKVNTAGWTEQKEFSLEGMQYDLNGNIEKLQRSLTSTSYLDDLTYYYTGNRLNSVTESINGSKNKGFKDGNTSGHDYFYDANGNMVKDLNKDITSIAYNYLNLPSVVSKDANNYIEYIYDAAGIKLAQIVQEDGQPQKTTIYSGEFIYEDNDLQLIQHEEGRLLPPAQSGSGEWEYQYHLKDHLSNTRLTFTTKKAVLSPIATMETVNEPYEEDLFMYYHDVTKINSTLFDHTPGGTTDYAVRLNGTTNETTGLAQALHVIPGQFITAEVYAKYVDPDQNNWTAAFSTFMASIAGGTAPSGTVVEGSVSGGTTSFGYGGMITDKEAGAGNLDVYLNYVLLDEQYNYIRGGYSPMSTAPKENGNDVAHEKLEVEISVDQVGYVYIWFSNETGTTEAYFDDFRVTNVSSLLVQADDYYPFGLTFNSYKRAGAKENKYLYNGKEKQDALDIDWLDYGARMYMPEIGRFGTKDRLAELYPSLNPYQYTANNPIRFVDINGDYIDIYDKKNGLRLFYEDGKTYFTKYNKDGNIVKGDKYDGEGTEFTNAVVENLNQMGTTEIGKEVLNDLEGSKNNFTFVNEKPKKGTASFSPENDGGGLINAAALLDNKYGKGQHLETTAHELFHGYQYENGQDISSVNNEVGAYLYGRAVTLNAGHINYTSFGNLSESGRIYSNAMSHLLYGNVFNLQKYKDAVSSFHKGSSANGDGAYNNVPDYLYIKKFQNPLIEKFYPLVR